MTIVAYLVTSHRAPDQVLRLLRTLRSLSPAAPLLLHHDGRREAIDARAVRAIGGVSVIPPEPVIEWGRASRLDMLLRCWGFAVRHTGFDWLTVVSGQDYPVRPLEHVERELAQARVDGFLEGQVVPPPALRRDEADEFGRRYHYVWRPVPAAGPLVRRAVAAARPVVALRDLPGATMLGVRWRTPFTPERPCRRGSDWPTLTRRCVELLDRAPREHPRLLRHFRRTIFPAEAFAPTVLHAEPGLRFSGDIRRHMAWRPGDPHPELLTMDHLDALRTTRADFARKFDARVDARVLDELDRELGLAPVRRRTSTLQPPAASAEDRG